MKLLAIIRQLRAVVPRDDDANSVIRIEVESPEHPKLWGVIPMHISARLGENLNAGECVTVGMVLLARGIANQAPGSMARAYALSALENIRTELAEQVKRDAIIAQLLQEARELADRDGQ